MDEGVEPEPVVFDVAVSEFDELFVALVVELLVDVSPVFEVDFSPAFGVDFSLGLFESRSASFP